MPQSPEDPVAVTSNAVDATFPEEGSEAQASLAFEPESKRAVSEERSNGAPAGFEYTPSTVPVRFAWKVDAQAHFSEISPEFAAAVGPTSASVIGRSFRDVAASYGLDANEEIAELLERRDTWSGRTVLWPIEDTSLRAPIELAALPIYSRDRVFMGFRGFGVVRMGDVTGDPKAIGMTFAQAPDPQADEMPQAIDGQAVPAVTRDAASSDAFNGERPAIAITPRAPEQTASARPEAHEGNVIPLKTQRPLRDDGRLNDAERNAFREIAERLRREVLSDAPRIDRDAEPEPAAPETQQADTPELSGVMMAVPEAEVVGPGFGPHETTEATDGSVETTDQAPAADFAENIRTQARQGVDTSILAALPLPVLIHRHGEILYANPALLEAIQYDSAGAINDDGGLSMLFADEPDGDDEDEGGMNLRRSDGSTTRVQAHLQAVRWDDNTENGERALLLALSPQFAANNHFDDSERQLLQTRVDELNAILDTATDGVILLDFSRRDPLHQSFRRSTLRL